MKRNEGCDTSFLSPTQKQPLPSESHPVQKLGGVAFAEHESPAIAGPVKPSVGRRSNIPTSLCVATSFMLPHKQMTLHFPFLLPQPRSLPLLDVHLRRSVDSAEANNYWHPLLIMVYGYSERIMS